MERATETATAIPTTPETARTDAAGARRDLARLGMTSVILTGGSMRPTYREGERVLVRPALDFRPGDVALLDSKGTLLLHRIVGWAGARALHAGDACTGWGVAGSNDLIGRVEAARPCRPSPRAHAALLACRAGAMLDRLGIPRGMFRGLLRFLR